jgi:hypothetical protein
VELHRVSYPVEDFLNACREAGRPTPVYDRLKK